MKIVKTVARIAPRAVRADVISHGRNRAPQLFRGWVSEVVLSFINVINGVTELCRCGAGVSDRGARWATAFLASV